MDLNLAIKLLQYGGLLKRVMANNSFDYSIAQATSKWIVEGIQGCSPHFSPLADSIQCLKDAVALSSGLGITEMWSALLTHRQSFAERILSQRLMDGNEGVTCPNAEGDGSLLLAELKVLIEFGGPEDFHVSTVHSTDYS